MTLWTSQQITEATGGQSTQDFEVTGLSIDTRTIAAGDLFVALKDVRDGHDFIPAAVAAGAGGVLCETVPDEIKAVRVQDTSKALEDLGVYARNTRKAFRIGVTGSVGKTSVKDALNVMLSAFGMSHKSIKSFNNHFGVPITLATIPEAADFAVLEMGMNHAGEMSALSKMARPQIALINNVVGAHLAHFKNVEAIADAKAEIIDGMDAGQTLILNGDNSHTPRIRAKADEAGLCVITFGHSDSDDIAIVSTNSHAAGGNVRLRVAKQQIDVTLMVPGEHWFMNAAACMAVAFVAELPLRKAAMALRKIVPAPGRGDTHLLSIDGKTVTLIDESYNANPTSMRAAFSAAGLRSGRKLALLGDMFELGADELELHRALAQPLVEAGFTRVFMAGECMRMLMGALPQPLRAGWSSKPQTLLTKLKGELLDGDIVLIKGSNASGVGKIAAQLKGRAQMLYEWLAPLGDEFQLFNLFNYITFRVGGALMTSLIIFFVFGERMINALRARQGKGQPIREDGPESHIIQKAGTPTMGGLLILLSVVISTLLWGDLHNKFLWVVFFVTVGFGAIGFYDDYLKVSRQSHKGFSGKIRLFLEFAIAAIAVWILTTVFPQEGDFSTGLAIPLLKNFTINLGLFFVPFGCLVVVGTANAVNLTDGLDGLAIVPVMIACMSLAFIAYLVGNFIFANYLGVPHIPGSAEITIFLGAIIGASLGFLWFNAPPAMVFMGDTGSLALGGALGVTAVAIKHEIVLAIIGGLFVLEAVSVIVQVASFKLTGKRVFRMAPIHHHFEKKGWQEPTIVIRFWIIAIILALIGLSTLKLR